MSKAILISIRPKWCELIAGGTKTIEVRKTAPKIETPFKCYIYCTKPSFPHEDFLVFDAGKNKVKAFYGGGKVIGEFVCDYIERYATFYSTNYAAFYMKEENEGLILDIDFGATCLTEDDFFAYGNGNDLFGWHISELKIYDKPKKLSDFVRPCCERVSDCGSCPKFDRNAFSCKRNNTVKRPSQSWMYVEELS